MDSRTDSILDVFRYASGSNPSEWKRAGPLGSKQIESLRSAYFSWASGSDDLQHPPDQLWPLISHHDDIDTNVVLRNFVARADGSRGGQLKDPLDALKVHLTACDGVVLADPLRRIFFEVDGRDVASPSSDDIHRVADRIGQLEDLLRQGAVRISKVHADLSSPERQEFITPFHLGPNMRTLTDVIQEGIWVRSRSRAEQELFPRKVRALLSACGIRDSDFPPHSTPLDRAIRFARALMEISWQLSNVIATGADLYLTTPLEMRAFEVLLEDCADTLGRIGVTVDAPYEEGRHLQRLATVGLPALDVKKLSFRDLVDIRSGEAFAAWRTTLNGALDAYAASIRGERENRTAAAVFRTEIKGAAHRLNADVKSRSLRTAMKESATLLPFAISVASFTGLMTGSLSAAGIASVGSGVAAEQVWRYMTNRQRRSDRAALRFMAAFQAG